MAADWRRTAAVVVLETAELVPLQVAGVAAGTVVAIDVEVRKGDEYLRPQRCAVYIKQRPIRCHHLLGIRNALAWVLVEANSMLVGQFIRGHKGVHRVVQVVQCRILCATWGQEGPRTAPFCGPILSLRPLQQQTVISPDGPSVGHDGRGRWVTRPAVIGPGVPLTANDWTGARGHNQESGTWQFPRGGSWACWLWSGVVRSADQGYHGLVIP